MISFLKFLVSLFEPIWTFFAQSVIVINKYLVILFYDLLGNDSNDHPEQWVFDHFKVPISFLGKLVVDFVSQGRPEIGQLPLF